MQAQIGMNLALMDLSKQIELLLRYSIIFITWVSTSFALGLKKTRKTGKKVRTSSQLLQLQIINPFCLLGQPIWYTDDWKYQHCKRVRKRCFPELPLNREDPGDDEKISIV